MKRWQPIDWFHDHYKSNDPRQMELPVSIKIQIDPKYSVNAETEQLINTRTNEAIPNDEPRILFRARDIATVRMLEAYRSECARQGSPPEHLQSIDERIAEFRMWQRAHVNKVKRPD